MVRELRACQPQHALGAGHRSGASIAIDAHRLDFWFLHSHVFIWNGAFPLTVDGQPVTGVTGF